MTFGPHVCGARRARHGGAPCQAPVKAGKRCRIHGGRSTGAKTPEGKAKSISVRDEGRRRWLEERYRLRDLGLIDKIHPHTAKKKGAPPTVAKPSIEAPRDELAGLPHDEVVRRGLLAIELLRDRLLKPR